MMIQSLRPLFRRSKMYFKPFTSFIQKSNIINCTYSNKCATIQRRITTSSLQNIRIMRDDVDSDNETDAEYEQKPSYSLEMEGYARDLLQTKLRDVLFGDIYNCVSIQELFTLLNKNVDKCNTQHLALSVLVLYDLKRIYDDIKHISATYSNKVSKEFLSKLEENDSFKNLLKSIENKIDDFDEHTLSYTLLYLNKLGMEIETPLLQLLSSRLQRDLIEHFSISPASKFLEAVFSEVQLRSYFMSQDLVPFVFSEVASCNSVETLKDLTISLNKLHNMVTDELLEQYKQKIENFINKKQITSDHYKTILQIIALLNYPKWRDKNSTLMSKCILIIKNNLNVLNVNEIILLYEIFFKIQEPGEILNELQRCSSRHYHQLDDIITVQKITLLSTIIYFASPNLRSEFQKIIKMYVKNCNDFDNLLLLRKLLSHIKISDMKVCQLYWDKLLEFLKTDKENIDVLKLCQNYTNFTADIENFRHKGFENEILSVLKDLTNDVNYKFFPQKLAHMLSFVLIFGNDKAFLEYLVDNLEQNWMQLKHVDCLKLSLSLRLFNGIEKKYMKLQYAQRTNRILNKVISKEAENEETLWKNIALLKSCIFKNDSPTELVDKLLKKCVNYEQICSKNIDNISYCFYVTNSLIPEVLEKMVSYMVTYKEHILGFNIGKIVHLLYNLGYCPQNSDEFFNVVANIVTRDQERMTGLTIIQCALGLCFFNKLPNSLVKAIFNVEFMDKLDIELQNCYSKDKYPQRVRNNLMQLNRAVCLDYPECNVPWFHQKYLDESIKCKFKCSLNFYSVGSTVQIPHFLPTIFFVAKSDKGNIFAGKVREYLIKTVNNKGIVEENVVTPYGYNVDFVVNFYSKEDAFNDDKKLALLLIPEFCYTRMFVNLKGPYQLKKRHLEILGYKVIILNFKEWIDLFYAGERIEFLTNLLWSKQTSSQKETINR